MLALPTTERVIKLQACRFFLKFVKIPIDLESILQLALVNCGCDVELMDSLISVYLTSMISSNSLQVAFLVSYVL